MEYVNRYIEQVQTTLENMRRRLIGIYDGVIRIGKNGLHLVERAQEVAEPAAYDLKEAMTNALQDVTEIDPNATDLRNSLLELYLGCSVLAIGLSAGEISGAFLLGTLYEYIFDWWWELLLVFLFPYYVYLTFRKNAALDEMERRVNLFGVTLSIGSFLGHLIGNKLVSTMPAVIFIQPLIIGLAVDTELSPSFIFSNRKNLLSVSSGTGIALAVMFVLLHGITVCALLSIILQSLFLAAHFQVVMYCIANKMYGAGEAQLCYVIGTAATHIITAVLFGTNSLQLEN